MAYFNAYFEPNVVVVAAVSSASCWLNSFGRKASCF